MSIVWFLLCASLLAGCETASEKASAAGAPPPGQSASPVKSGPTAAAPDNVIVYYFHFTSRCRTCLGIQSTIEKTIKERFAAEAASAVVAFQAVNLDLPENKHFTRDYNVSFSSMVVAARRGNTAIKWENCDKVWEYAHNEVALTEYVEQRLRAYVAMLKQK